MIPLSLPQTSHSPLCGCTEPALTLWPVARLIFGQLDDDMLTRRSEMERRMHCVNRASQLVSQDLDGRRRLAQGRQTGPTLSEKSPPRTDLGGTEQFELSLDVGPFSPEELTVKTVGRRVRVTGKHEQKRDSEGGSFFHEYREWRREVKLPEDVNPEDVLCSLSEDGRLLIQAPRLTLPAAKERAISIRTTRVPVNGEWPTESQSSNVNGEGPTESQSRNVNGEGPTEPQSSNVNGEGPSKSQSSSVNGEPESGLNAPAGQ